MKYVVEFNPHGDPTQVEVEAETLLDAVEQAYGQAPIFPETIDGEQEPSYRAEAGGQSWQRITINVLPGGWPGDDLCDGEPCGTHRDPDDPDCCAVCGEAVLCDTCGAPMNDFSGEVPCCSNPHCEVHP
jgi:hypothetical protein